MKYDVEYNSYKFSKQEIQSILDALRFYTLYHPMNESSASEINKLIDNITISTETDILS